MATGRQKFARTLFAGAALSAGALVERTLDPFDRHDMEYNISIVSSSQEDPDALGVVPYSVDEEGNEESDPTGQILLVSTMVALAGGLALRAHESSKADS